MEQHIIQKVFLEVNTTSTEKATYLRQNLDVLFYQELFPWLEAYFQKLEKKLQGRTLRFEELSLSVESSDDKIGETLKENLIQQLEKEVGLTIEEIPSVKPKETRDNKVEAFLYFLEHGTLPWYANTLKETDILEVTSKKAFQQKLKILLHKKPLIVQRLVNQLTKDALLVLLKNYTSEGTNDSINKKLEAWFLKASLEKIVKTFRDVLKLPAVEKYQAQTETSQQNTPETFEETSLYLKNTGLILLAPYLPLLFRQCGLLNENNILNDRILAAHLLHYLATGNGHPFEFEMGFEKFLCGISSSETLERSIDIPKGLKEEAQNLLNDLLLHWPQLKSTSTVLLQNEFLQRKGKLTYKENSVHLVVERKTQDILLEQLPWNFRVLKLPWLQTIIYTDW